MALPSAGAALPGEYLHDGFYLRFELGPGYTSIAGSGSSGRVSIAGAGASLALMIGGSPVPGLVVGGALRAADADGTISGGPADGGANGAAILLAPFVDFYPDPAGGWHVGGSVGIGGASVSAGNIDWTSFDLSAAVFGGYDWWIGPQWSLGLFLAASAGTAAALEDGNHVDSGYRATPASIVVDGALLLH